MAASSFSNSVLALMLPTVVQRPVAMVVFAVIFVLGLQVDAASSYILELVRVRQISLRQGLKQGGPGRDRSLDRAVRARQKANDDVCLLLGHVYRAAWALLKSTTVLLDINPP